MRAKRCSEAEAIRASARRNIKPYSNHRDRGFSHADTLILSGDKWLGMTDKVIMVRDSVYV